ncbi:hypothetical protein PRZ48_010713 [Zasmidium cellare]|uniref:N-acetyltransferase domain-containing protein n=1 Tax=Zasmidium cellare TaxID=395010 RepID=A0ABR0E9G5_ZASCE|nr:hypothetical protein PRZ48_010713 [Zasmidium cellare]
MATTTQTTTTTHLADPTRYNIRPAQPSDFEAMTTVFYASFTGPFWSYLIPNDATHQAWWDESWALSHANPTDRQFVVEDLENNKEIVAFSRWMLPQDDGNQERKWPELKEEDWDMPLMGAFFGGMEENRKEIMGERKHWMCELLGTHASHQNRGIAASLLKWGTDQADKDGLETYLDGSAKGQPYYIKRHGFKADKEIPIPDHEAYGSYKYVSMVRPPQGG